ncbi:MAG TPA: hypothetical protein VMZ31_04020 [Phycisphaerae bacterium]|nr:hypothetical protein [Phycisphaerae bacterium]
MSKSLYLVLVGCLCLGAAPAKAQQSERKAPWELWPTDRMIEMACDQIGRRYNLTPEQDEYTRALMSQRVKRFLGTYEGEIRSLLKEAWTLRLKADTPTAETAKTWAERARPIFEAAKKEILEGNKEWREVLNEQQQQVHDVDMRVMEANFRVTAQRLDRWRGGGFDEARDWARGGLMGAIAGQQTTTTQPRLRDPGLPRVQEDYWQQYVERFIQNYKLDESQTQTAQSILSECKQRAKEYRQGRKEQFGKANKKYREALAVTPRNLESIREARREVSELNRPIKELFRELRDRLDGIPTAAQKQAYDSTRQERVAQIRRQWEERRTRMQSSTSSQPTTTQATATTSP